MRLHHSLLTSAILMIGLPALAAESGTYRPGQPYMSVPAQSPDQCQQQCSGDAQCKGWNFVQVRRSANASICEFNARKVAPVASAISISGDSHSATDSSRIVQAGRRTVRVGAPAPQPVLAGRTTRIGQPQVHAQAHRRIVPQQARANAAAPQAQPAIQQRQMMRGPARQAVRRQVQPVPQMHRPTRTAFRHSVDMAAPQRAMPARPQAPAAAPARPQFKPMLDTAPQADAPGPVATQPTAARLERAPNISEASQASMPRARSISEASSAAYPSTPDSRLAGAPTAPVSVAQAQNSLFGSLYDDVKAPKTLTPADIPADPDAPIPTVHSIPTVPIEQSPY